MYGERYIVSLRLSSDLTSNRGQGALAEDHVLEDALSVGSLNALVIDDASLGGFFSLPCISLDLR